MKRSIIGLAMVALLVAVGQVRAGLTTNLVGYWGFDGNGQDASGGGRDLTIYGGAGFGTGLFGQALSLTGNKSQYAARPSDDAIYDFGSSDFTVQGWVNYNSISDEQVLVEKFYGDSGPGWTLAKLDWETQHWLFSADPAASFWSGALTIPTDVWHQVVIRRDGDEFDLFYDGDIVAQETDSDAVPDTSFPLLVGKRNEVDGRGFGVDGRIDEVAIWTRALSDGEVAYLYNGGAGNPIVPEPSTFVALTGVLGMGLVGYWSRRRRRAK